MVKLKTPNSKLELLWKSRNTWSGATLVEVKTKILTADFIKGSHVEWPYITSLIYFGLRHIPM